MIPHQYDPMSTFLPDRRIGRYTVRGNHDRAVVYEFDFALLTDLGVNFGLILTPAQRLVNTEDNRDGPPPGQPASAFERAAAWAVAEVEAHGNGARITTKEES